MFYLAQNLSAQAKLQAELDSVLGAPHMPKTEEEPVLGSYEVLKSLPYLQDVVNEGLRLFSIIGLGLPRVVPEGGLTILGRVFAPRTVISVPSYVVHHDKVIWGDDADSFNPDRWAKGDRATLMKAFTPFSIGPRCVFIFSYPPPSPERRKQGVHWAQSRIHGAAYLRRQRISPL